MREGKAEESGYPRIVNITCPFCSRTQRSVVHFYKGDPFPAYDHECERCGREIGESEWNEEAS